MNEPKAIFVHCSATQRNKNFTVDDIRRWHKAQGWSDVGYHAVVLRDGTVQPGRPETTVGAHTFRHNGNSLGICYIGGIGDDHRPQDTRTDEQRTALILKVREWMTTYNIPVERVYGHYEFANKACPCFDMDEFREQLKQHVNISLPTIQIGTKEAFNQTTQLQRTLGVAIDGIIGPETYKAIAEYYQ